MERIRKILFCVICSMFVAAGMAFTHGGEVQAEESGSVRVTFLETGTDRVLFEKEVKRDEYEVLPQSRIYAYDMDYSYVDAEGNAYVYDVENEGNRESIFIQKDADAEKNEVVLYYKRGTQAEDEAVVSVYMLSEEQKLLKKTFVTGQKVGERYTYQPETYMRCGEHGELSSIRYKWRKYFTWNHLTITSLGADSAENKIVCGYKEEVPGEEFCISCYDSVTGKLLERNWVKDWEELTEYRTERTLRVRCPGSTEEIYAFDEANPKNKGKEIFYAPLIGGRDVYYRRQYLITLDAGEGSCEVKSYWVGAGLPYGELPEAKRKGYIFEGWYTKKKGGNRVDASVKVNLGGDQTLYARWAKLDKGIGKVKLNKPIRKGKRKVKLTWKQAAGAEGYEILCADNRKLRGAKTYDSTETELTLKKLKKGKTYYIKARGYRRKAGGQRVYGAYGKVRKVRIK